MGDALTTDPAASRVAVPVPLRVVRDELASDVLSGKLAASELPARYAAAADEWLGQLFAEATKGRPRGYALVAVGGHGRRELCPGSDLDLVLIHRGHRSYDRVAQAIWYAIWDSGIALDHSVRTRSEVLDVARSNMKAVLGLLDGRLVAGDDRLCEQMLASVRELWAKQSTAYLRELEQAGAARHRESGELAFLLEPDVKQSAGGLRDLAALRAIGAALPDLAPLVDTPALAAAERLVLATRVVLHCRTGRNSDRLLLQEQDEVASVLGFSDADALMAGIADAGRSVTAASVEIWRRVRVAQAGGRPTADVDLGGGVVLRGGEVAIAPGTRPADDPELLLKVAVAAAQRNALVERETLDLLELEAPRPPEPWASATRDAFLALLGTGDALVPVVEALDQRRLFERLLPEWSAVRNRPQRNAYHRFTVDRHLLEAVVRAGEHVHEVDRPDLLLLGALLHDIGKGYEGDHSEVGEDIASEVARRMGFDDRDVAVLARVVAYHLVLPEVATRRDLDDPSTIGLVARVVEDRRTLALLAALTEADSRATGSSAWSPWKAELVTTLAERVGLLLDGHPLRAPVPYVPDPDDAELLARGALAVRGSGRRVTVIAPDRPGLLAAAAGALALHRCNVRRATASAAGSAMAVEVFDVEPQFDCLPEWDAVEQDLAAILDGKLDVANQLAAQERAYAAARRPASARRPDRYVVVDNAGSDLASIVEVRAPDRFGLLYEITATLAANGCDVEAAFVDTIGHGVVDSFYVRGPDGGKLVDGPTLEHVSEALSVVAGARHDKEGRVGQDGRVDESAPDPGGSGSDGPSTGEERRTTR
jgi:[protein-PII] uridylyltransferase